MLSISRNRNIVIKSQFNIGGSRGKSVKKFISDYVSRDAGTNVSMAYINPTNVGDGVSFTLGDTAISREETLAIAEQVEQLFLEGKLAVYKDVENL